MTISVASKPDDGGGRRDAGEAGVDMLRTRSRSWLSSSIVCGLAWPAAVAAQQPVPATLPSAANAPADGAPNLNGEPGDVIVTARRANESLQKVPVSITAVSTEQLRTQQVINVAGLQRISPSLTVTKSTRGSGSPAVMIRGQRFFNSNTLADPAVTVYFAEVGQSLAGGGSASFFDLQSVEVLKGPQGTLFGRNTTGGAVLITPVAPSNELDGYGQAALGDYRYRDFEGAVNLPLGPTLAVRAAGKITRRRGYLDVLSRDGRAENLHADSARLSLRWAPSEDFESTTIGTYFKDNVTNGSKLFAIAPSRLVVPAVSLPLVNAALARNNAYGKYEVEDDAAQTSRTKILAAQNTTSIDLDVGLDRFSIKNIASYRDVRVFSRFDIDGSTLGTVLQTSRLHAKVYSEEFQVSGQSGSLSMLAGLFYYQQNSLDTSFSQQFALLAPALPALFPSLNYGDYDTRNRSLAAFAHADLKLDGLAEGLSLSAGARYTKDRRSVTYHNRTSQGFTPTAWRCTLTGVTGLPDDRNLCVFKADALKFNEPTYDASLNWQLTPRMLVYGAFRHGYRSGGFNNSPPSSLAITNFRPEKVDDFEIGLKTSFRAGGMSGRVNIAAYYDKLRGGQRGINSFVQAAPPPAPPQFVALTVNAGQGHIQGGEAEFLLLPVTGLTLSVNASLIDAKYDTFFDSYLIAGVATPIDVSDSKFAFVPKYQVNASARYEVPLANSMGTLAFQATYYHQSRIQTAEINTSNCGPNGLYRNCVNGEGALSGFGYGNVRAEWRGVANSNVDISVFVNNVTDRFYRPSAANALGLIGLASYSFGEPRMFGAELRVRFGKSAD